MSLKIIDWILTYINLFTIGSGKSFVFLGAIIAEQLKKSKAVTLIAVPTLAILQDHLTALTEVEIIN